MTEGGPRLDRAQGMARRRLMFAWHRGKLPAVTLRPPLLSLLLFAAVLASRPPGIAGPAAPTASPELVEDDAIFHRGKLDLQVADGAVYSLQYSCVRRPNIYYTVTAVHLGYMVDSPHRGGTFLRGNDEFLLEAVGGAIFQGPGNALGGLSILYRRNFLAPGARLVPYLNLGAGGVYSDAYHDQVQKALGSRFEFDLQASVGLRCRLARRWTVDGEFAYRHLSNAHLADRNLGTNAIGGLLGVSYAF